jgi:HAE1 family hydrophobic/amphiphilic exporter-1
MALKLVVMLILGLALLAVVIFRFSLRVLGPVMRGVQGGVFSIFDRSFEALRRTYTRVLGQALRHREIVIVVVAIAALIAFRFVNELDSELIPEVHQGEFTVEVRLPRATRLEKTDAVIGPWESVLLDKERFPEIATLTTTIGVEKDDVTAGDDGDHTARLLVRLERSGDPEELEERVKARLREILKDAEFESVEFRNPVLFSFKTPIEVEVKGRDLEALESVVRNLEARMRDIEEIKDVRSNLARGSPEVRVLPDRVLLLRYGSSPLEVGDVLRRKLIGEVKTYFTVGDRKVPIRVRLKESNRDSLVELDNLIVNPGAEREFRLRDVRRREFVDEGLTIVDGPAEIRRIAHQRAGVVSANLAGMSLGAATKRVEETLRSVERPADFVVDFGGQHEEMQRSTSSLQRALILAVFLVFVVMAMQFESFTQPLVIIVAVPLAFVGVTPVLWWLDIPLSIVVFIGMIVLAGIVVNNAIVLVDTANQLQKGGLPLREALVRAGELRLRPILMTTSTTVLGLLPLTGIFTGLEGLEWVVGSGDGAEIRAPLAITVIAGLISSTMLTLLVVPVIASFVDSVVGWFRAPATSQTDEDLAR